VSSEMTVQDLMVFWQDHEVDIAPPSLAEVRRRPPRFQTGIRLWNVFQYVGGVLTILLYGRLLLLRTSSFLEGLGETLTILAGLCGLYLLRKGRSARSVPASLGLNACLDFHRSELARQRDFLLKSWRYLLLAVPGFIVLQIDAAVRLRYVTWSQRVGPFVIMALFLGLVVFARRRQANRLQREIDSLPHAERE